MWDGLRWLRQLGLQQERINSGEIFNWNICDMGHTYLIKK